MIVAVDSEVNGVDLRHGARPFFVTVCNEADPEHPDCCEWPVDPLTREPQVDPEDVAAVAAMISAADEVVAHNAKFDSVALATVGIDGWPWDRTHDTTISAHLLASNQPKNLTDQVLVHLGKDIKPLEDALEEAVKECRRIVQQAKLKESRTGEESRYSRWTIAERCLPCMPSAKEECWRADYWLPAAMAREMNLPDDHPWRHVLRDYANADSAATLALWIVYRRKIEAAGLWDIYLECRKLPGVVAAMEEGGVTVDGSKLAEMEEEYRAGSAEAGAECVRIAEEMGCDLTLPKSGNNKSLTEFCFGEGGLRLPVLGKTDGGAPSLDKHVLEEYEVTLDEGPALDFVKAIRRKRKQDTAIGYLESYRHFWLPLGGGHAKGQAVALDGSPGRGPRIDGRGAGDGRPRGAGVGTEEGDGKGRRTGGLHRLAPRPPGRSSRQSGGVTALLAPRIDRQTLAAPVTGNWHVLYTSTNVTATDTLRGSCSNPNGQQVSKQEDFNLRRCFGPAPGKEWWCADFENVELRIPAYESGERCMVELFEKPDEPPFFGSYHLMNASLIYPDEFWPLAEKRGEFKKRYAATLYQWIKNFGFAFAYGCGAKQGDKTAHKSGAYFAVKDNLKEHTKLSNHWIAFAQKKGYVETMPDRTVDPRRGYPLLIGREFGRISPTKPLCYHVSGTAMWCTRKAMPRCQAQLDEWRRGDGFDGRMVLQVHDEIIFEFPAGGKRHLPRARKLRQLMEQSGDDIGVPLRVALNWHPRSWAESEEP